VECRGEDAVTATFEFLYQKLPTLWPLSAAVHETVRTHCSIPLEPATLQTFQRSSLGVDESVALRGPFTFQGDISDFTNEAHSGPAVFMGGLTGRGTAEAFGVSNGLGVSFNDLVYNFDSAGA
jgi:hypothetical protein